MKPAVIMGMLALVGLGGYALAKSSESQKMKHGATYRIVIRPGFNGEEDDIEALGFTSVQPYANQDINQTFFAFHGVWNGPDNATFTPPPGMDKPEFLGTVQRMGH